MQQWKVLVIDEDSKKILDSVVKEDDILNQNIASMHARTPVGSRAVRRLRRNWLRRDEQTSSASRSAGR